MRCWRGYSPPQRNLLVDELRTHLGVPEGTRYPPLTWDQVRCMNGSGMTFGSHTVHHSMLPAVDRVTAEEELRASRQRLEQELGSPCVLLAYPDGRHSAGVEGLVASAGFRAAVTQDWGANGHDTDPLQLRRVEVPYHDPLPTCRVRASLAWPPDARKAAAAPGASVGSEGGA